MSFFLPGDSSDIVYMNLRDRDEYFSKARNFKEWVWVKCKKHKLLDSNHQQESRKHLHARFWEEYLGVTLLNRDFNPNRPLGEGCTDYTVEKGGLRIHIEAVVSEKGDSEKRGDVVPDDPELENPGDCLTSELPERQIQLRLTSSIKTKYDKWLRTHSKKPHVSDNDPFVIALNGNHLGYCGSLPMIVKVLFAIGPLAYSRSKLLAYYQSKPFIMKADGTRIDLGHFLDSDYSELSGILYSHVNCVNRPKRLGGEFIFIHNPHAENKIPLSVFSFCKQYVYKKINETNFWFDIIEPGTLAISNNVATF